MKKLKNKGLKNFKKKKLSKFAVAGIIAGSIVALAGVTAGICLIVDAVRADDLIAPTDFSVDEDNKLTWSDVENARSYIVRIKNVATGKIDESTLRRESISLSGLEIGDYEISIKALGGRDGVESAWSETYYFYRAYETGCLYKLINNTEYQIASKGNAAGKVVLEDIYRGKPVTSIAKNAFRKCWDLEEIVIGNNVRTLEEGAFLNCKNLKSVTIPESVTSIGVSAFQDCGALTSVSIPDSVTQISNYTFAYCDSLERVELHESITAIGEGAFNECSALKSIDIPDAVVEIGAYAFRASGLTSVAFGSGLETIEEYAFNQCASLQTITFAENGSLQSIGQRAFAEDRSLTSVVFPEGLVDFGYASFYLCENLAEVSIPDSVTHISAFTFNSTKLFDEGLESEADFIYADNWLIACNAAVRETMEELTVDTLKEGTVGIADEVFYSAAHLKSVVLPETVKAIGDYAFYQCPELWKLDSNKVEWIGKYAFSECKVLKTIILGEGLKTIDNYAFYNCTQLDNSSLGGSIIPDSVERIGTFAFKNTSLWNKPDESGVIYAGNWVVGFSGKPGAVTLKDDAIGVADYAFYQCSTLQSISGLSNVDYIGRAAFYECTNLTSVSLSRNLKKIEDYTFYKCTSLFSVSMPARLKEIGRSAFYKCEWLNAVDLARSQVEKIGPYAFYGCLNILEADLGESLVSIDDYAFYKCSSIGSLVLPDTLQTIGNKAFYKCEDLRSLDLGEGVERVGEYAFYGCKSLEAISVPASVKTLERNAFYKCVSVESLELAEGIETIGDYAFYGLENLSSLSLPANVNVGKYAFKGCASLKSLVLSSDVGLIADHAFYGCKNMTVYTDVVSEAEANWSDRWNSSYRPVVWGCTLSEDKAYVISVPVTEGTVTNFNTKFAQQNVVNAPEKEGYRASGWATEPDGELVYQIKEIVNVPVGTTLYPVWRPYLPKLTFVYGGFDCDPTEMTIGYGETYEEPDDFTPPQKNATIEGFYKDAAMTIPFDFTQEIYRDKIIYVKWLVVEGEDPADETETTEEGA